MEKHDSVSIFIYSQFPNGELKLLLLIHKKFQKWIVPGGHVEDFENPVEAAIREVSEETGIKLSADNFIPINRIVIFPEVPGVRQMVVPAFMFEQEIPEHKGQPPHYHIDHVYFVYNKNDDIVSSLVAADESQDIGWYSESEVGNLNMFQSNSDVAKFLFTHIKEMHY